MAWPKIVYEDIAVGGAAQTTATAEDKQPWCRVPDILEGVTPLQAATLEQDYWVLGTDFHFFPNSPSKLPWGWWTASMSDENGNFAVPPVLNLKLDGYFTCVGLTFTFDPYGPTWPTWMKVQWYRDGELLAEQEYQPNAYQYSAIRTVHLFDQVVVTFDKMSHGYRYLKMQESIYGIIRTFGKDEYSAASFYQVVSLISDGLEISDLVFNVRNTSSVPFTFQRKQQLAVYHGTTLLGLRFITKSEQMAENSYKITAQDLLGVLNDSGDHNGGVYDGELSEVVLADILGEDIEYTIADELKGIPIHGWLPMDTRINNLTRVLFAIGGCASTARTRYLKLFKPDTSETVVPVSLAGRSMLGPKLTTDKLLTGVQMTEHSYTPGTETMEAYKGELNGTTTVTFSEPMCAVSIEGGTIEKWEANYAIISGTGETVILTGTKYNHSTRLLTKTNPLVESGTIPNVKKCDDAYLVSPHNSTEVLNRYFNYYLRNQTVTTKIFVVDDQVADLVQLENDFHGEKVGNLVTMDITLSKKLAADVKVLLETEEV